MSKLSSRFLPSITQINEKEVFIFFSAFHCLFACSAVRSFFSSFRRANRLPHRRTHTRPAQAPTKTEMLRIFRVYQLRREHEAGGEEETGGRPKYNSKINTDHDLLSISWQRRAFLSGQSTNHRFPVSSIVSDPIIIRNTLEAIINSAQIRR